MCINACMHLCMYFVRRISTCVEADELPVGEAPGGGAGAARAAPPAGGGGGAEGSAGEPEGRPGPAGAGGQGPHRCHRYLIHSDAPRHVHRAGGFGEII